jgi:hypothetical protein
MMNMKKTWIYAGIFLIVLVSGILIFRNTNLDKNTGNVLPAAVLPDLPPTEEIPEPPVEEEEPRRSHYIEIIDVCDWTWTGQCVNVRGGPGTSFPIALRLRTGIVLKVEADTVEGEGRDWYKVIFDKNVRYPERVASDWYVAVDNDAVREFKDVGEVNLAPGEKVTTDKRIVVSIGKQMLYAYDGDKLYMEQSISTGIELNPTPSGKFRIYRKTPSRYMQGPLPDVSDEYYDLPGVPWDLYFSVDGAVIHGAYWHNDFGTPKSHGCVNQTPENAKKLYEWADIGTLVIVER